MVKKMTAEQKILLVEDEKNLAAGLEFNLRAEGYAVVWAADGRKALELYPEANPDLVILDIMLPFVDGFEVARQIREDNPRLPILFLTARTSSSDRVRGLELGADDYLTKPFHLEELILRVKGMLKRKSWYEETTVLDPVLRFGNNTVDFSDFSCRSGDEEFMLTPREAMLLKFLVQKKGTPVSRAELLQKVWNINSEVETRTVDNFIVRLRRYFEPDPENPVHITSIRGVGYMFTD